MAAVAKREKPWAEKISPGKQYPIDEALALVKQFATAKFDETRRRRRQPRHRRRRSPTSRCAARP